MCLLKCPCGLRCVGKTKRELRIRISEHKSSVRNFDEKSCVMRHFNSTGHDVCSLRFQGMKEVKLLKRAGNREKVLLQREVYWIHTLQTEYPKGMNEELLLGCFQLVFYSVIYFVWLHYFLTSSGYLINIIYVGS